MSEGIYINALPHTVPTNQTYVLSVVNGKTKLIKLDDMTSSIVATKESVGLGLVDNTADQDKPISIAQQEALDNLTLQLENEQVQRNFTLLGKLGMDNNASFIPLSNVTYESYGKRLRVKSEELDGPGRVAAVGVHVEKNTKVYELTGELYY